MLRNVYYTYEFEVHKNLPHKRSVLFYGLANPYMLSMLYENDISVNDCMCSVTCIRRPRHAVLSSTANGALASDIF